MKTILASTYAVNPYKGSEDGMGWNFVQQIARFQKVIAITRKNNRPHIERYMREHPAPEYQNIQFLYFDLPYWMRFWKKGSRGAMLYFWLWQFGIVRFIKKQHLQFDIAHNLNFHNDWTPSFLWKLGKPFVWGPIGHHPLIPRQYLRFYRRKYWLKDRLTWLLKKIFWNWSPALRKTVDRADFICCMNASVAKIIPLQHKRHTIIPSVATEDFGQLAHSNTHNFTLISAGRLVPLKGFDLSILAFAKFLHRLPEDQRKDCELVIVGSGAEASFYKNLAQQAKVAPHIRFIPWIERSALMTMYQSASAFLFPSHEGAGMVVAEALSFGLPVICLDNHGPGEFVTPDCGFAVAQQDYDSTVEDLSKAIGSLYVNPVLRSQMGQNARLRFEKQFHWDRRGEQLRSIYQTLSV